MTDEEEIQLMEGVANVWEEWKEVIKIDKERETEFLFYLGMKGGVPPSMLTMMEEERKKLMEIVEKDWLEFNETIKRIKEKKAECLSYLRMEGGALPHNLALLHEEEIKLMKRVAKAVEEIREMNKEKKAEYLLYLGIGGVETQTPHDQTFEDCQAIGFVASKRIKDIKEGVTAAKRINGDGPHELELTPMPVPQQECVEPIGDRI